MQKEPSSLHSQDARFRLNSRRDFLSHVGRGMLVSSVGSTLAFDFGLAPVFADEGSVWHDSLIWQGGKLIQARE
ncbi:hypothetical protein OAK90_00220 [bacterium]|nr:hypothetical protein [bacterium]